MILLTYLLLLVVLVFL